LFNDIETCDQFDTEHFKEGMLGQKQVKLNSNIWPPDTAKVFSSHENL